MKRIDMKCLNCGGDDFERVDRDGIFTLPYSYNAYDIEVPRYFYACLGCGLVHQVLDLEARQEELLSVFADNVGAYMATKFVREGVIHFCIEWCE